MSQRRTQRYYMLAGVLFYVAAMVSIISHDLGTGAALIAIGTVFVALAFTRRFTADANNR